MLAVITTGAIAGTLQAAIGARSAVHQDTVGRALLWVRRNTGSPGKEISMWDLLMVAFTIGFFVVALLYVAACEKLR